MPEHPITYPRLRAALRELGYEKDPIRSGPGYTVFERPGSRLTITLPTRAPMPTVWASHLAMARAIVRMNVPTDLDRLDELLGLTQPEPDVPVS